MVEGSLQCPSAELLQNNETFKFQKGVNKIFFSDAQPFGIARMEKCTKRGVAIERRGQ